ncbi:MAG: 1-deoxy-D-xylulose-5-phosphate reductoisomerase [Thermodesulfobacteriota bacterium]|nr:1-deoxy-D-xylulose-5-phosphate reductoisomerase [Thermodesulfobacteriota bacterium]
MKRLSILGSTGSIGQNALELAAMHPHLFDVAALAAATSLDLLLEQIRIFTPDLAVVRDEHHAKRLKSMMAGQGIDSRKTAVIFGESGYQRAASHEPADIVLLAMVGAAGLKPALAAIDAGKRIALANKETLVMAGRLVMERAAEKKVRILPVDSEHSAIFQCLEASPHKAFKKIFLTASGGPFRNFPADRFKSVQPEHALNHPTWAMGSKITIDSATLMNKGLEIIEAVHLFGVPAEDIEVLVHPQSIVHSMVGFRDGAVMAQMGIPDMKGAISYAFTWPDRIALGIEYPDFAAIGNLSFEKPDVKKFPSLGFAYEACACGGTMPAVMNAANEVAVNAFLEYRLDFPGIYRVVEHCMAVHDCIFVPDISDILAADAWARQMAEQKINCLN